MKSTKRTRAGRRQGGMTLIEVLISIMLLAVGVAGMIAIQVLAMRDEQLAREDNEASRIARDVMEQVHRMPFDSVAVTGDFEPPAWIDNAGYAIGQVPVQVDTPDGPGAAEVYQVTWDVTAVAGQTSLRNVDVRVGWTDAADRAQVYNSSTLKYDP
jgi:type IV pilus assembly protein PilV